MGHRTLLLSPWYLPLRVIRWEDAVKLRYEGTAEVIVEYSEEIRSPSVSWRVPAVLRLRKLKPGNRRGIRFSRRNVHLRDGYRCQYCGIQLTSRELTCDHVVPRSAGGRTGWENIVAACRPCNSRKGNRSCDEASMWPAIAPVAPRWLPVPGPSLDRNGVPKEWVSFLPA